MIFLLDANVLINAKNFYYPIDRVPEFWDWLVHQGETGNIKVPVEIYQELISGTDELVEWAKDSEVRTALELDEEVQVDVVRRVVNQAYAPDLNDVEQIEVGRDPFLISYAYTDPENRSIVTEEVSKPSKIRGRRRIPDACDTLNVNAINTFNLIRTLDFSTGWNR